MGPGKGSCEIQTPNTQVKTPILQDREKG